MNEDQHLGLRRNVSAGCLANDGHEVIGVDPIQTKVDLINQGRNPIFEQEIGDIITANVKSGRLRAVFEPAEAIQAADLSSFFTITMVRACYQPLQVGRKYGRRSVIATTWSDEDGLL